MNDVMKNILKELGVRPLEEFRVGDFDDAEKCDKFYFEEENGCLKCCNPCAYTSDALSRIRMKLVTGLYWIIKIPFKPKFDQRYFFVTEYGEIDEYNWQNDDVDYLLFNMGNCFETREEITDEMITRIYNELVNKYNSAD